MQLFSSVLPSGCFSIVRSNEGSRRFRFYVPQIECLEKRLALDDASAGTTGINSRDLRTPGGTELTGFGIGIGQVETGRPGLPGFDNAANSHPDVTPTGVFLRNAAATANANTTNHGHGVAGIMIASGAADKGVARNASLYSSAAAPEGSQQQHYEQLLLSMQHVALQNGGDVRAINLSFASGEQLDGTSLLTLGLDWSARVQEVLYAKSRGSNPTDNYNGINVAQTRKEDGVFRQISVNNDFTDAPNGRRLSNVVAPGFEILTPQRGGGAYVITSGASNAAPHVTAAVALLQQYGDAQGWGALARRPQVMKAVLMNSVDKVQNLLCMEKTILKTDGFSTWLQSDARDSADNPGGRLLPLDDQMGSGQLNASRAVTQFSPGRKLPGRVPPIGWDLSVIEGAGTVVKYTFQGEANAYVSMTLAWDRNVVLNDTNQNGQWDVGETFAASPLTNLDLYLLPKGATSIGQNYWSSESDLQNVEHIFFQLPETRQYEVWVRSVTGEPMDYGLAWWTGPCARAGSSSQGENAADGSAIAVLLADLSTYLKPKVFAQPQALAASFQSPRELDGQLAESPLASKEAQTQAGSDIFPSEKRTNRSSEFEAWLSTAFEFGF